jgi:hypothetical protein
MVVPHVRAGMKQAHDIARCRVDIGNVGPLSVFLGIPEKLNAYRRKSEHLRSVAKLASRFVQEVFGFSREKRVRSVAEEERH